MEIHPGGSAAGVDGDAASARAFAISLDDATASRFEATMKVVLTSYGCDARRIAAAAAACRVRHEACATVGWDEAAALLEQALRRLRDAGADVAGAAMAEFAARLREEMFPEPAPFTWPDRAALERRWRRRAWAHARLRWKRQAPRHPGAHQLLLLRIGGTTVGKLDYQVCDQCRRGYVRKLGVDYRYRGLGLGSRAVRAARRGRSGYTWHTTPQYLTAGTFWIKIGFRDGDACPHMRDT